MARWFRRFLKNWKRSARRQANVTARAARARHANWTVGVIAALLVLLSAGGYFYHRKQLNAIAAEHLRLFVAGPSCIQSGLATRYTIEATTIDGCPLPAEIEVVISEPDGEMIKAFKEKVGEDGRLVVTIPADMELPPRIKLKVAATHDGSSAEMESVLPVLSEDFRSWLTLDRSVYQPGDTVHFRLLTLSEFGMKEAPDSKISCKIIRKTFPPNEYDPPLILDVESRHGIAAGTFDLPGNLPEGSYDLEITGDSSEGHFGLTQEFQVLAPKPAFSDGPRDHVIELVSVEAKTNVMETDSILVPSQKVFYPGTELKLKVRSIEAGRPMAAVALFKGVQVGQTQFISATDENAGRDISIPIDNEIGGVIRVVLFDFGDKRPIPIAEQYVYRQPSRKLKVQLSDAAKRYEPGEKVKLTLQATDETGQPVPAVMSVSVGKVRQKKEKGEISDVEAFRKTLYTGNFKLDDDIEGRLPMDLDLQVAEYYPPLASINPPLLFDNGEKVRSNYVACLAEYQSKRTAFWDTLTAATFFGGLGLVVLVAMLGFMRIVLGMHLWVSAIGATVCCMILGAILMDPIETPPGCDSVATFTSNVPQTSAPTIGNATPVSFSYDTMAKMDNHTIKTVYWNPLLTADTDGKAVIEFDLPPGEATYQINIESHGEGRIGVDQMEIVAGDPVEIDTKEENSKEEQKK